MLTASTIPLLLLALALWHMTKGQLLSIVLFLSIFQAASVLNLGNMGITPWILILMLGFLIKVISRPITMPTTTININVISVRLLVAFVCYAIFSGLIYPFLFRGVIVRSSHDPSPGPLAFGIANIAQICYLLAAFAVFGLTLLSSRKVIESALEWYVRGCVVASIIAIYQLANAVVKIPYPSAILYSNPRYVIYPAYMINGMWRLNSTFTEASSMAAHLSVGVALLGWNVMTRPLRWSSSLSLALIVLSLLLTLSSTGYISFIIIIFTGFILALRAFLISGEIFFSRSKSIFMLFIILIISVMVITTDITKTLNKAVHSVLLDKESSLSYKERTESNLSALETAKHTYYIGSGWGSVRCSSLGAGLLSTVGVIGVSLFCAFLLSLALPLFEKKYNSSLAHIYEKSLFGILVILVAMMIAGNEPDQPILWMLFASCSVGPNIHRVIESRSKGKSSDSMIGPCISI